MKNFVPKSAGKISLLLSSMFLTMVSFAQDTKKLDIDINTKSEDSGFFMQPWVWVVGGAVFILLLIALLRGNSNK
jgi:hypothetical protein